MRREAGRRPVRGARPMWADPRELPPENGAEVPENESSNHTRLCGALRQGAKKSGPQSGGPEQLP